MAKILGAAFLMLLAAGSISPASAQNYVSIGTGGTAGVYYQLGGAMAEVLNKNLQGTQANAEVTNGSGDNIKLVAKDPSYIGLSGGDVVADAATGTGTFTEKQPILALAVLYPNQVQVVVRADFGISSIADMKGKHISTGPVGSGMSSRRLAFSRPPDLTQTRTSSGKRSMSGTRQPPSRTERSTASSSSAGPPRPPSPILR